ncbi:hypothetical protein MLD38_021757 [Melastoma candidum]|uniref:Uncharacterized protein n=1 Tax=Melastoma candidum TaxID=119954 RepID=A0ACB9QH49_9MYRT|nr:hypothetical protein MLD38_021757 [Melastoma candidum]
MIDILSSTKYKAKQFRLMCCMLDYMKRQDVTRVPIDALLQILKHYTEKYLTHVQKFAKKKKIRANIQPEINTCNLLLDSSCKCSLLDVNRLKSKVKPDLYTYNVLSFG